MQTSTSNTRARPGGPSLDQAELKKYPGYLLARSRYQAFKNFERNIGQPLTLKPVEFSVLLLLDSNGDVSQTQLSHALGVAAPNMTGILRRLEERELIGRVRAEADGRVQYIVLTAAGCTLIRQAVTAGQTMDRAWLDRLSPGEQAMLFELLGKLAEAPAAASTGG